MAFIDYETGKEIAPVEWLPEFSKYVVLHNAKDLEVVLSEDTFEVAKDSVIPNEDQSKIKGNSFRVVYFLGKVDSEDPINDSGRVLKADSLLESTVKQYFPKSYNFLTKSKSSV